MNKKQVIFFCIFAVLSAGMKAQLDVRPYIQLSAGNDPISHDGRVWTVKPEVGVDIRFVSVSLLGIVSSSAFFSGDYNHSIDLVNGLPFLSGENGAYYGRTGNSILLNAGVDFVKLFNPLSKHSFMLNAAGGYTLFQLQKSNRTAEVEYMSAKTASTLDYCLSASYYYQIAGKWRLGIYVDKQDMVEIGSFGITSRRYF
jgi:hypothetical protein